MPAAAIAPDTIAASYTQGNTGSITLTRSPSSTSEMNARAPGATGETWVGYLSPNIPAGSQTPDAHARIEAVFGLGRGADGAPFRGPFTFRVALGARGTANLPDRAVECNDDVTTNTSTSEAEVCVDTPTEYGQDSSVPAGHSNEEALVGDDRSLAIKDLGVLNGASVSAHPGSAVTMPFTIRSVGMNGSPSFNLTATTTVLGGSAIPAQTSFSPQPADQTVPVSLNVPAATAPGTYDVTLSATLGSQTRTGHGTLTVVAPQPAPGGTGGGGGTGAKPALTLSVPHQRLGRALAHGLRARVGCDRACAIRVGLGRLGGGHGTLTGAGRKVVVARFTKAARRKLRHRRSVALTVHASASAGGQTSARSVKLKLRR